MDEKTDGTGLSGPKYKCEKCGHESYNVIMFDGFDDPEIDQAFCLRCYAIFLSKNVSKCEEVE